MATQKKYNVTARYYKGIKVTRIESGGRVVYYAMNQSFQTARAAHTFINKWEAKTRRHERAKRP